MVIKLLSLVIEVDVFRRQTTVYVQVVFMKLGEIDTIKETFSADVFIQARWREPRLDGSQMAKNIVRSNIIIQEQKEWPFTGRRKKTGLLVHCESEQCRILQDGGAISIRRACRIIGFCFLFFFIFLFLCRALD